MRQRGLPVPGILHLHEDRRWRKVAFPARANRSVQRRSASAHYTAENWAAHFREAAAKYQLPEPLLRAVAHTESSFDPSVVSGDGAMGLMQLMPFTAKQMGVADAFDPRQNILGGARYLRILSNRWHGDAVKVIASYNAGPGAVQKYGGVPPYAETQRYVRRVLGFYRQYAGRAAS
jgi:soluble lytic murein transglycosylase-like protein